MQAAYCYAGQVNTDFKQHAEEAMAVLLLLQALQHQLQLEFVVIDVKLPKLIPLPMLQDHRAHEHSRHCFEGCWRVMQNVVTTSLWLRCVLSFMTHSQYYSVLCCAGDLLIAFHITNLYLSVYTGRPLCSEALNRSERCS